jgi:hypothetical protein
LFHEFGHLLYALHRQEMDDLVEEFQNVIADLLAPQTRRRRKGTASQEAFRQLVVLRYYEWCQEFFCDAVGLRIGGPAFAKALTSYFRLQGAGEFYTPREKQLNRRHPVGWLRIRMVVDRCRAYGLNDEASGVEAAWLGTARLLGVREDYEGIWLEDFFTPLRKTLDDMLEETAPRVFVSAEIAAESPSGPSNAVALLNAAWKRFDSERAAYRSWEEAAIAAFLQVA